MDLDNLVETLARKIEVEAKGGNRRPVSPAVRMYSREIALVLNHSNIRVTDIYRALTHRMGEVPCALRNFRTLCNKYCTSPVNNSIDTPRDTLPEYFESENKIDESSKPSSEEEDDNDFSEGDWQVIYEALGPLMKGKLQMAIDNGLTLEQALKSAERGKKSVRDIVSQYYTKRHSNYS